MPSAQPAAAQSLQTRRAFGYVLMSAVLPGSVQLFAGSRRVGRIATRVYLAALAVVVLLALGLVVLRGATVGFLLTPAVAVFFKVALWVLFLGWVALLLDSWRLARPINLLRRPRFGLTVTTLVLALAVGAVTSVAANAFTGVANVGDLLAGGGDAEQKAGRYNVLLLGADASDDRVGLRPDSINVASVDAETGRTVLFGLPRNMQKVPFPESSPLHALYPDGFVCDDGECMLNGVYTLGVEHKDLYPDADDPGLQAVKEAVSETLGLDLNYYALVDMAGFQSLIDAMGGITLDISKDIPIGGVGSRIYGYIKAGEDVHLDGFHALWFARSRAESSDYERMARQKCVMSAMVQQLDPMTVATKFTELSEAGKNLLKTDVGRGEVYQLAELALAAKGTRIASVNFSPPLITTADPDFDLIRSTVRDKIAHAEELDEKAAAKAAAGASPSPTAGPSEAEPEGDQTAESTPKATPSASVDPEVNKDTFTDTEDLEAVCSVSS